MTPPLAVAPITPPLSHGENPSARTLTNEQFEILLQLGGGGNGKALASDYRSSISPVGVLKTIGVPATASTEATSGLTSVGSSGLDNAPAAQPGQTVTLSLEQLTRLFESVNLRKGGADGSSEHENLVESIGLFDPDDQRPVVETWNETKVYHNVIAFSNKVKSMAQTVADPQMIAHNLVTCLRGPAATWYLMHLSTEARSSLASSLDEFLSELETKFKISLINALKRLESLRYTTEDVRARRDPENFVNEIVLLGPSADKPTTTSQILWAYERFEHVLRQHLTEPGPSTTLDEFLRNVNVKKEIWSEIFEPYHVPSRMKGVHRTLSNGTSEYRSSSHKEQDKSQRLNQKNDKTMPQKSPSGDLEGTIRDGGFIQPRLGAKSSKRKGLPPFSGGSGVNNKHSGGYTNEYQSRGGPSYYSHTSKYARKPIKDRVSLPKREVDPLEEESSGRESPWECSEWEEDSDPGTLKPFLKEHPSDRESINSFFLSGQKRTVPPVIEPPVDSRRCKACKKLFKTAKAQFAHYKALHASVIRPNSTVSPPIIKAPTKQDEKANEVKSVPPARAPADTTAGTTAAKAAPTQRPKEALAKAEIPGPRICSGCDELFANSEALRIHSRRCAPAPPPPAPPVVEKKEEQVVSETVIDPIDLDELVPQAAVAPPLVAPPPVKRANAPRARGYQYITDTNNPKFAKVKPIAFEEFVTIC